MYFFFFTLIPLKSVLFEKHKLIAPSWHGLTYVIENSLKHESGTQYGCRSSVTFIVCCLSRSTAAALNSSSCIPTIMLASVSNYQTDCMFPILRRVSERVDQQRRMKHLSQYIFHKDAGYWFYYMLLI